MSDQPKRRGRPPLDPTERKDGNLTFRARGDLRQRLSVEARKNGRTISEEVEWRLERSLAGTSSEIDDIRRIVREEIAAALTSSLPADWLAPIKDGILVRPSALAGPFQIHGRDSLQA